MLALGPLLVVLAFITTQLLQGLPWTNSVQALVLPIVLGLALEATGLIFHARDLGRAGGEGMASLYEQRPRVGDTYLLRNAGLGSALRLMLLIGFLQPQGNTALVLWLVSALLVMGTALIGRALFYALVIPTTMPGGFFWRNKGFEEHARATGLAEMPQVGVLPDCH